MTSGLAADFADYAEKFNNQLNRVGLWTGPLDHAQDQFGFTGITVLGSLN